MAKKSVSKTKLSSGKSRVNTSKNNKGKGWFKPWYAIVGVVIIAVVGIVVVRLSQAGSAVWKDAPSFSHSNTVYYTTDTYRGKNPSVPAQAGVYTMQSANYPGAAYKQIWGPYLNLPYSQYIDVCFLVNTTRSDTRVDFDVTAWEGQKVLATRNNVSLADYVNKKVPYFVYPGYCIQNIPLGGYRSGVEFRAKVLYGDMKFNGVTYRQH